MICIASILLILAVLVQSPKSGMAANFGAANQTMGVRQTTDFLEKFTWAMIAAIVLFSLLAATSSSSKSEGEAKSVLDEVTYQDPNAKSDAEAGAEAEDKTGKGVIDSALVDKALPATDDLKQKNTVVNESVPAVESVEGAEITVVDETAPVVEIAEGAEITVVTEQTEDATPAAQPEVTEQSVVE
jgi:preprotein translocase subunit SecG